MNNKEKRILHLLASNLYSGAENVVCTIITNKSDKYDMAYCSPNGSINNILKEKNIKFYPLRKLSYKEVKRIVNEYKADIIHAHDFKASLVASLFNKKCTIISHLHKNDPQMKKNSVKSFLYNIISKKFFKVVGVSDSILNEYIHKDNIKNKYITLFNYVDKDKINEMADQFKIEKKYDLFYLGRLSDEKNPLEFINIVDKLENKYSAVMIGDGPLMAKCREIIENKKLNIDLIGFQPNPFPYIKNSKIGIMPSKFEGFGLAAVECTILNKPVFNSGVGGLQQIFGNNSTLICNNTEEYVSKIKSYFNNNIQLNFNISYSNLKKFNELLSSIYEDGE